MQEPPLPFEFNVFGTPLSLGARYKSRWQDTVRAAAAAALPRAPIWLLTDPIAVTIYIFPDGRLVGDVDNRVKPILDAMSQTLYTDDELVERVVVQKFEPGAIYPFANPSAALVEALEAEKPVVYVKITGDVHEELV